MTRKDSLPERPCTAPSQSTKTRGTLAAEGLVLQTEGAVLVVPQELVSLGCTCWGHASQFLAAVVFSGPLAPVAWRVGTCPRCGGIGGAGASADMDLTADVGLSPAPKHRAPPPARGPLGLSRETQKGALSSCPQVI